MALVYMPTSPELECMIAAAEAGGGLLQQRFGNHGNVSLKSHPSDFQTSVELAVERSIIAELRRHFPDCGILAEEEGNTTGVDGRTFVVDPLDGTNNTAIHQRLVDLMART